MAIILQHNLRPNSSMAEDCNHPDYDFTQRPTVPSPQTYQENLAKIEESRDQNDYERNRKRTGLSKPSILSGLVHTLMLLIPMCFTLDLMHLIFINICELLLSMWRGTMTCESTDSKTSWDWIVLTGEAWIAHGKLVAAATQYFPSSFHRPPRNPAEKISSGYKATEYFLYVFGLGPGPLSWSFTQEILATFLQACAWCTNIDSKVYQGDPTPRSAFIHHPVCSGVRAHVLSTPS